MARKEETTTEQKNGSAPKNLDEVVKLIRETADNVAGRVQRLRDPATRDKEIKVLRADVAQQAKLARERVEPVRKRVEPVYRERVEPVIKERVEPVYRQRVEPVYRDRVEPVVRKRFEPIYRERVEPVVQKVRERL